MRLLMKKIKYTDRRKISKKRKMFVKVAKNTDVRILRVRKMFTQRRINYKSVTNGDTFFVLLEIYLI